MGKVTFVYLGLSIGGDPKRLIFWEPVLRSIKYRLSGFNSRFLSFGGCLIILKEVLISLPFYSQGSHVDVGGGHVRRVYQFTL